MSLPNRSSRSDVRSLLIVTSLLVSSVGFSQSVSFPGELGPGDTKLGRYFDTYPLQLAVGERVVATLSSHDFDAYLYLESPEGRETENDDYGEESDGGDARIDALVDVPGIWRLKVSSYEEGEEGAYLLTVDRERLHQLESFTGMLDEEDPISVKGEHYDSYTVFLERNQRVVISMFSEQFDPFLVLKPPAGRRMLNDDYYTETESRIDFIAEASGQYEIFATSYTGDEQGDYSLRILLGERMNVQEIGGYLDSHDQALEDYGFYEMHPLHLEEGQRIILEMISEEVDTLLFVEGPDGFYAENDDYNDQIYISRLEIFAPVEGEYIINTGSFDTGVEGSYTLKIYSFGISGLRLRVSHQLAMAGP
jgi:hypothetical protein